MKQGGPNKAAHSHNTKGAKKSEEKMTVERLEADLNIPQLLKGIIEDSDDDIPLRFDDPAELMDIFSTLEEQNLFLIKRC
jgi:hypothetical protein